MAPAAAHVQHATRTRAAGWLAPAAAAARPATTQRPLISMRRQTAAQVTVSPSAYTRDRTKAAGKKHHRTATRSATRSPAMWAARLQTARVAVIPVTTARSAPAANGLNPVAKATARTSSGNSGKNAMSPPSGEGTRGGGVYVPAGIPHPEGVQEPAAGRHRRPVDEPLRQRHQTPTRVAGRQLDDDQHGQSRGEIGGERPLPPWSGGLLGFALRLLLREAVAHDRQPGPRGGRVAGVGHPEG